MDKWKLIDGAIILCVILLFTAGRAIGSNMTGITSMTTDTLTVTGDISMRGSVGAVPQAAILMFNTSCPTGYTRQTQFDGAIPYGAAAYSATPGGSSTHSHTIASHTHTSYTIAGGSGGDHNHGSSSGSTSSDGDHAHMQPGSAGCAVFTTTQGACAGSNTAGSGTHSHSLSLSASTYTTHAHSVSGSINANTGSLDTQTTLPAYAQLVFCKKN